MNHSVYKARMAVSAGRTGSSEEFFDCDEDPGSEYAESVFECAIPDRHLAPGRLLRSRLCHDPKCGCSLSHVPPPILMAMQRVVVANGAVAFDHTPQSETLLQEYDRIGRAAFAGVMPTDVAWARWLSDAMPGHIDGH